MITNKNLPPFQFLLQVHKHTVYNVETWINQQKPSKLSSICQYQNTIRHAYKEMKFKQSNQQQDMAPLIFRDPWMLPIRVLNKSLDL
ncbi:unnamed protein product [Mucor fragilis]